jgi:hypothetical protein
MKTVGFHSNQLGIRGTEVALYDYALYNEEILGNKSYIISNANAELTTLKKFQNRFEVFLYKNFEECYQFVEDKGIEYVYYIKAGDNDGKVISGIKNAIHAVFQNKDVHGDSYAYVSKWLAEQMGMGDQYVPHIVCLPEPKKNYKEKLNIPERNIIIGRYGGFNDFDLPFVYKAIEEALKQRNDITFLFMNTRPFISSNPNVVYVEGTYNLQNKADFINTCDYMIHARQHGESFGLAICEFLFNDKPVISWKNGLDKHHISLLNQHGIWYETQQDLYSVLTQLKKPSHTKGFYKELVEQFSPKQVMKRFEQIFLK